MKSCTLFQFAVAGLALYLCAATMADWSIFNEDRLYVDQDADTCPPALTEDIDSFAPVVRCITGQGTGSLTESNLKTMIDTVSLVFSNYTPSCTVLTTPDNTLIMYQSGGGTHAEEKFLEKNKGNLGSFPFLWINNSPCPNCSLKLINAYNNAGVKPPTIYAAHFYGGTSNASKENARQCLANMVKNGFTLMAFDWKKYKTLVTNVNCQNDIDKALSNAKFVDKMNNMANTIATVYNYSASGMTTCKT